MRAIAMANRTALLLAACLVGCSTSPIPTSQASRVPADRIHSEAFSKPGSNTGTLVVKRDTGLTGSGCNYTISINGGELFTIGSGEVHAVYPPAGKVFVGAYPKWPLCPGGLAEVQVNIEAGKTEALRLGMDGLTGTFRIQPTAP